MGNIEIERKFLVTGDGYKAMACGSSRICQGYICRDRGRTVRVRVRGTQGFLTIKGPSADGGISRYEYETEVSLDDAAQMLRLCQEGLVDKSRWLVDYGGHTFEVDEFYGDNAGLVVAEVELSSPDEAFDRPPFLGREVTGDRRFYNSSLSLRPFSAWDEDERKPILSQALG